MTPRKVQVLLTPIIQIRGTNFHITTGENGSGDRLTNPLNGVSKSREEYSDVFFFEAQYIQVQDRKKAVLLSGVGAATYNLQGV